MTSTSIHGIAICKKNYFYNTHLWVRWGQVLKFAAAIDIKDLVIFVRITGLTGRKWQQMLEPSIFIRHFGVAEGFHEDFEGRQGRVAIGVLKSSLFLA